MKVRIILKGWYQAKLWNSETERLVEVLEGTTCDEALRTQGINYKDIPRFGFVAINKKRVLIDQVLRDGDDMEKAQYSKLLIDIPEVDVVVKMGCNVVCPYLPADYVEDWGLKDLYREK